MVHLGDTEGQLRGLIERRQAPRLGSGVLTALRKVGGGIGWRWSHGGRISEALSLSSILPRPRMALGKSDFSPLTSTASACTTSDPSDLLLGQLVGALRPNSFSILCRAGPEPGQGPGKAETLHPFAFPTLEEVPSSGSPPQTSEEETDWIIRY